MPSRLALGMTGGLALGMTGGLALGMTGGLALGMTGGLALGMTDGLALGMTDGLALGMTGGLERGGDRRAAWTGSIQIGHQTDMRCERTFGRPLAGRLLAERRDLVPHVDHNRRASPVTRTTAG